MAKPRLTDGTEPRSEVRLELSDAEGHQIWALSSERAPSLPPVESSAARFVAELPAIAWRWRRLIVAGALAGVVAAVAYLWIAAPVYVVRALVHIEQRESVLQRYDALRSGATFIATQAEVIQSPRILGNAFDVVGLPERGEPGPLTRAKRWLRSLLPSSNGAPLDPRTLAILEAQASLGASAVLGTDLMAVTYRTANPQRGVAFLDALIAGYRDYVRALETDAHREGLELLREQDEELHLELEEYQKRYDTLHAKAPLLGEGEGALSVQKLRLEEHARAHVEAQGRRIELENRLAQQAQNGAPLDSSTRNVLLEELRTTEALLAELRSSRSDAHPDVRDTAHRIELLREQVAANTIEQREATEAELRAARRTEAMLSRLYEDEWGTAKQLELQRLGEEQIRREIERIALKRDAVSALLRDKEIRVLSLESGHSGTVVRLLDPPAVPMQKAWPRPPIVLVAFGFLGTLGGLGLALFAEHRRRRTLVSGG